MKTILKNCHVIDGKTNDVTPHMNIVIEGDMIIQISNEPPSIGLEDHVIDCSNQYVIPGLIDAHVHLMWDGSADDEFVMHHKDDSFIALKSYRNALRTLSLGITSVRDVGSIHRTIIELRNAIESGLLMGPTVITCGEAISMTGGHVYHICREIDGADEARKATRQLFKEGADFIKVMATGGMTTYGEEPGSSQLTKEELQAVVEEAHKRNKKVAAHTGGLEGILTCLEAGIDTIEHGIYANEEALQQMKEQGTYLIPTLEVYKRLAFDERVPAWVRMKSEKVLEPHRQMLERAIEIGVNIVTGTDAGSSVTGADAYFDELLFMHDVGMTPMQVIHASTRVAAECLDLPDRGVLAEGKKADLLILPNNPLENLHILKSDKMVMKNGKLVDNYPYRRHLSS